LSFAHWANDVANAIWPLAAINDAILHSGEAIKKVWIPFWIMILWALSLSFWLAVFGTKLIKTVWSSITKLDQTRAYSIAISAAMTVIMASAFWIPVSTTQIALGWIFGIWLYRQYLKNKSWKNKKVIEMSKLKWILLSWVITLPVAWLIASGVYLVIIYLSK
jgi:PiT family inorganic phosphate transporter